MSTRQQQTFRSALVFSAIAAAFALGACLPRDIVQHDNARAAAIVPNRPKEDVAKLSEEIQKLRRARYELLLAEHKESLSLNLLGGKVNHWYERVLSLSYLCLRAVLDDTDDSARRLELLVPLLNDTKKLEASIDALLDPAKESRWYKSDLHRTQILRKAIEIEILNAKKASVTGRF